MAMTVAAIRAEISATGGPETRRQIESVGDAVTKTAGYADKLGAGMLAAGGVGLAAFGKMAGASVKFSAGMANVNSIARLSADEMANLEGAVLDMASEFGAMPDDLTAGLYDIVSSGFEATEALEILEAATVAAGAGLTDTATSTKAITAVLNAYGLEASSAGDVSDVLFKTIEGGVITFEELAANMGTVLPTAANLGIEIEELGAAYAEMTLQGTKASAAETSIAALMRSALAPTTDLKDAITQYGYASAEALIQTEGLTGYLQFLDQASGGSSESLLGLVGSQVALTAATILSGDAAAGYIGQLDGMAAGQQNGATTLEVFGIQMDTTADSIQKLQANLQVAAISMGRAFEPMIQGGVNAANALVEAFNGLSPAMQGAVGQAGAFASVMAVAFGGLLLVVPRIAATVTALKALRTAMVAAGGVRMGFAGLLGAINPVGAALTALGLAGLYAWNVFREGQEASRGLEDALVSLGDVAQSLRLGHRDIKAGFVEDFRADSEAIRGMAEEYAQSSRIFDAAIAESERSATDMHTVLLDMQAGYRLTNEEATKFAAAQVEIGNMFANSQIDAALLDRSLDALEDRYRANEISLDQYADGVIWFTENQDKFRLSTEAAAAAGQDQASAMAMQAAEADALAESMQGVLDRLMAVSGMDTPTGQFALTGQLTQAAFHAHEVTEALHGLDTVFRATVGNTNAIAQQASSVNDWALELINVRGEYGKIDDLKKQGYIDQIQYNAAQRAQGEIAQANAHIQNDVLTIQAMQAPLIAEHTQALEAQMHTLSGLSAEQQLVALGWMDTTTAARAMEFQALAVAVANGEMGASGERAFSEMISGAAAVDPVLTAVLEDMGLITAHEDGTFTVHLEGAEAAMSDLDRLNLTIVDLIDVLDDGFLNQTYVVDVETGNTAERVDKVAAALKSLSAAYATLPKTQATPFTGDGTGGAANA